jgi:hypothetical protein
VQPSVEKALRQLEVTLALSRATAGPTRRHDAEAIVAALAGAYLDTLFVLDEASSDELAEWSARLGAESRNAPEALPAECPVRGPREQADLLLHARLGAVVSGQTSVLAAARFHGALSAITVVGVLDQDDVVRWRQAWAAATREASGSSC